MYQRQLPDQSSPYAFQLPNQRYLQAPAPQGSDQQGIDQLVLPNPGSDDPLAEVEGLTDAYYDTWGKLDSFAKSFAKDYKIDVTKPDLSQPGGGMPFKTYQRLDAALRTTANRLSNKQKEITQMRPYVATGQVTKNGDNYETQALLPEVEDILKKLDGPFYSKQDADRARQQLVTPMLQRLMERGDINDPLVRHNIEVLKGAGTTHSTYPGLYTFQPREDQLRKMQQKAAAGASRSTGALKRFTALKNGFWPKDGSTIETDTINGGTPSLVNYAHSGEVYGKTIVSDQSSDLLGKQVNQIVDKWVRRPDKSVWIYFKPDPETGYTPPPEQVDKLNGADITAKFQQSNPKYGQSNEMFQAIDVLGWADPNNVGSLNEQGMYNADIPTGFEDLSAERDQLDSTLAPRAAKAAELKATLGQLRDKGAWYSSARQEFQLPGGEKIEVLSKKTNDNFYIPGVGDNMTLEDVMRYLDEKGYYSAPATTERLPNETEGAYQLRLYKQSKQGK